MADARARQRDVAEDSHERQRKAVGVGDLQGDRELRGVWYGWFYDATGKQVCRSTKRTDRRAAARVRAEWERDAAEPGHAAARDAVLLDAIEL